MTETIGRPAAQELARSMGLYPDDLPQNRAGTISERQRQDYVATQKPKWKTGVVPGLLAGGIVGRFAANNSSGETATTTGLLFAVVTCVAMILAIFVSRKFVYSRELRRRALRSVTGPVRVKTKLSGARVLRVGGRMDTVTVPIPPTAPQPLVVPPEATLYFMIGEVGSHAVNLE